MGLFFSKRGGVFVDKIRKRDGTVVPFDPTRIARAIYKASCAVGKPDKELAEKLTCVVIARLKPGSLPTVEEIQDIVEQVLMEHGQAATAKAYILYRRQRQKLRDFSSTLMDAQKMIKEYVGREHLWVNENSNMNYSCRGSTTTLSLQSPQNTGLRKSILKKSAWHI